MLELNDKIPSEDVLFQQGLLHYLWYSVPPPSFAASYYLTQWYHDAVNGTLSAFNDGDSDDQDDGVSADDKVRTKASVMQYMKIAVDQSRLKRCYDKHLVEAPAANLIARHFSTKRPFAKSFDTYFRRLMGMANDNAMQIRIRAFKAVSSVIDADGSLMGRPEIKNLVESRMWDTSAMIRDTVVEMIGNYARENPEHIQQYHDVSFLPRNGSQFFSPKNLV